jgi:hypothetical protein
MFKSTPPKIIGATNPVTKRGVKIYSPGEGPKVVKKTVIKPKK